MDDDHRYEEFEVFVYKKTDLAALCEFEDGSEVWVPFSLMENDPDDIEERANATVYVSRWFAEKEGLV